MSDEKIIDIRAEQQKKTAEDAWKNCTLLYTGKTKSCRESLMCFGWECPDTWNEMLRDLSYELEELNIRYYSKYRARIEAVQVKTKFGFLHFYFDVHIDPPKYIRCWHEWLHNLTKKLDCGNKFAYKSVEDSPRHTEHEVSEITKEQYEDSLKGIKCSNVEYKIEGDRYFKVVHLDHYAVSHHVPTKRRLRYWLMKKIDRLSWKLDFSYSYPVSREQRVVAHIMQQKANEYIRKAEEKSEHICEECGNDIGYDERHPACTTFGWISYLCKHCAEKQDRNYSIGKKIYNKGVELKKDEEIENEETPEEQPAIEISSEKEPKVKLEKEPEIKPVVEIKQEDKPKSDRVENWLC